MVVSIHLTQIGQIGSFLQIWVQIKNVQTTTYMSFAVFCCIFFSHWIEDGSFWDIQVFHIAISQVCQVAKKFLPSSHASSQAVRHLVSSELFLKKQDSEAVNQHTEMDHTRSNVYQQAIKGFLS